MKEEINKVEIDKLNRWGGLLTLLMLAVVILPVPLMLNEERIGLPVILMVLGVLFVVTMAVALKVEKIKKDNDVHTYKEIVAFTEGRRLDELDKAVEKGKRPYQALVAFLSGALIALLVTGGITLIYMAFSYLTKG